MQYINPLIALDLDPKSLNSQMLKQARKKMLAEFELQEATVIDWHGQEVDRATVLGWFDQLEDQEVCRFHQEIAEQPSLLNFLESAALDLFYQGDISMIHSMPSEVRKFMGPYFAESFNKRLFHAFRQYDWEEIDVLCGHPLPIPATYHASAYKDTYRYLHGRIEEINALTGRLENGETPDGRVQEYTDEMLVTAMNRLPQYFESSRDRYAQGLEGLGMALHNQHRRVQLALLVIRQGLKLEITPDIKARLQHILDQLEAMSPTAGILDEFQQFGQGKDKKAAGKWAVAIGILVLLGALILL